MREDRLIAAVIGAAGLLIAAATYLKPEPKSGRYALAANQFGITRLDTQTGRLTSCFGTNCVVNLAGNNDKDEAFHDIITDAEAEDELTRAFNESSSNTAVVK